MKISVGGVGGWFGVSVGVGLGAGSGVGAGVGWRYGFGVRVQVSIGVSFGVGLSGVKVGVRSSDGISVKVVCGSVTLRTAASA